MKEDNELLEKASNLCHIEWMDWSKNISKELEEVVKVLENNIQYLKKLDNIDDDTRKQLITENTKKAQDIATRLDVWKSLWIDYEDLSDEMKEYDRIYARKILELNR